MPTDPPFNGRSDHDLLIEAITKLDRAISDIATMDRNFTKTISDKVDRNSFEQWAREFRRDMEKDLGEIERAVKDGFGAQQKTIDDHEIRIRRGEKWGFMAIGALALFQILIAIFK